MKITRLFLALIFLIACILRFVSLDKFPAGLNADEAAIGYNAYSLLETGKDEHGQPWPLVFRSFDDYKPPLYFYLALPFVKFLGLNIWSVRLPSAMLGSFSVLLIYQLIISLQKNKTKNTTALLASFLLAISPWHLQFSRGGWEVNVSTFFMLLCVFSLIKSFENSKYLYLFSISTIFGLYTYHSVRLIMPFLFLSIVLVYREQFSCFFSKKSIKNTLFALVIGVILILPLVYQLLSKEGQSRFSGVSVFSDPGPLWRALALRNFHQEVSVYVKLIHNQYFSYFLQFIQNYLSHYSPRFLFFTGDEIARSKVPGMGQSLISLLPFYFIGIFSLLKFNSPSKKVFAIWFFLAPIAAAVTFQSPHALRAANMVIPLVFILALGIKTFLSFIKNNLPQNAIYLIYGLFSFCIFFDFSNYLHLYYVHYPKELPYAWQYGFDQIASYVQKNYDDYDKFVITDRYDQPYILMAFFLKYPPSKLQKELVMTPRDKFGFSTVRNFDKFEFHAIDYGRDKQIKNALIVSADEPVDEQDMIYSINDPGGKVMYKILKSQ